jgi:hypothetical protein
MTEADWRAEVEGEEPFSEGRAILTSAVEAMFDPALGTYAGAVGERIEVEPPSDGAVYSTGADWAKERDWSVFVTLRTDVSPVRLVAFQRIGRELWPSMIARFEAQARRYPHRAAHDATGLGNVVSDYLTIPAVGYTLSGKVRGDILSTYISAIEGGKLLAPRIAYAYDEHRLATRSDLYGAGHLPDSVCAMALAYYVGHRRVMRGKLTP